MSDWPGPKYWNSDREIATPLYIQERLLVIIDEKKDEFDRFDKWFVESPSPEFRSFQLPFYRDVLLTELMFRSAIEDEAYIYSYLMTPDNKEAGETSEGKEDGEVLVYRLNGTSSPIHEANAKHGFSVTESGVAAEYLKFFMAQVWGNEGGFWIVESASDLACNDQDKVEFFEASSRNVKPMDVKEDDEGAWLVDASVCYGRQLFAASLSIKSSGLVEMLDDNPVVEGPLPIRPDSRSNGARVVDAVQGEPRSR